MNYPDLFVGVPVRLRCIGDEPSSETLKAQKPVTVVSHHGKRDYHSNFPKGLPKAFVMNEKE